MSDDFYKLKGATVGKVKRILKWANANGLKTEVTMLDAAKSFARVQSDKDFDTVLGLINKKAISYFVIIVRKQMNLFLILASEKVISDILEIGIRGIDADSKEYFIMIYMDKRFVDMLKGRYELKAI